MCYEFSNVDADFCMYFMEFNYECDNICIVCVVHDMLQLFHDIDHVIVLTY